MFTLPLREITIVEEGRERNIIAIVVDRAVPEDAELAAMAARYQTSVIIQEVLKRQFDMFLMHVRSTLMAEPTASADRKRELLNPNNDDRLRAALAAAAGSPRFVAIIEPDVAYLAGDDPYTLAQLYDQLKGRGAGRK